MYLFQFPWSQCLRNSMRYGTMHTNNSKVPDYHGRSHRQRLQSMQRRCSRRQKFGIDCLKIDTLPRAMYIWLVSEPLISSEFHLVAWIIEMEKDNADCGPLLECTTGALGEEAMQMLLISTQQTNLALCVKYAVKKYIIHLLATWLTWHGHCRTLIVYIKKARNNIGPSSWWLSKDTRFSMQEALSVWFPHVQVVSSAAWLAT